MFRSFHFTAVLAAVMCLAASDARAQITRPLTLGSQGQRYSVAASNAPQHLPQYVDLDSHASTPDHAYVGATSYWNLQVLPDGLIYESYLAGIKESRFGTQIVRSRTDSTLFNSTLGARIGLIRYGTYDIYRPEGWQIDAEGSAQVRLDIPNDVNLRSTDYRAGLPITYGIGKHRWKLAYYHLSSHVGDEFLGKNMDFVRLNYSRDVFVLGYAHYLRPKLRAYVEAGWAFYSKESEPWEFQFGVDYAPCGPTGLRGAPFFALNGALRQEVDFGGALTAQAGWAWRGSEASNMLRAGLHYYNGKSNQFSFFDEHEEQIGAGLWYDF